MKGVTPAAWPSLVRVREQGHAGLRGHPFAVEVHLPELPGGVHMQEGERRRRRMESLTGQVQHHRRVLADGIEHHRLRRPGHGLADDLD